MISSPLIRVKTLHFLEPALKYKIALTFEIADTEFERTELCWNQKGESWQQKVKSERLCLAARLFSLILGKRFYRKGLHKHSESLISFPVIYIGLWTTALRADNIV